MNAKTIERISFGAGTAAALLAAGSASQQQGGSNPVPSSLTDAFNAIPWWGWLGLAAFNGYFFFKTF